MDVEKGTEKNKNVQYNLGDSSKAEDGSHSKDSGAHLDKEDNRDEENNANKLDTDFSLDFTSGLLSQTDDPSTPALTVRAVFLGLLFGFLLAALNIIGTFRDITLTIPTSLASIICYPIGIFFANVLPPVNLIPGHDWSNLNPGRFSVKEHVLIYIIASSAGGKPYGVNNVVAQKLMFKDDQVNYLNSILWVLATQLVGFGITGLFRRYLVRLICS